MIAVALLPSASRDIDQLVRSQAQEILRDGLTQEELLQAVELLLISTAKWAPNFKHGSVPAWYLIVLAGGLAVSIMLSIRPKVVIGIGRGQPILERWRLWLKFVGVALPAFISASFIGPWLYERMGEWLK